MPDSRERQFRKLQKLATHDYAVSAWNFLLAWVSGSLAGAAPFSVVALALMAMDGDLLDLEIVLVTLALSATVCLIGLIAVGLPATVQMRVREAETQDRYLKTGLVAGVLIAIALPLIILGAADISVSDSLPYVLMFGASGAAGGTMSAYVWACHRLRLVERDRADRETQPNPIHELLH